MACSSVDKYLKIAAKKCQIKTVKNVTVVNIYFCCHRRTSSPLVFMCLEVIKMVRNLYGCKIIREEKRREELVCCFMVVCLYVAHPGWTPPLAQ